MNKNVSGNLRHARIQSACAIAGLLLIVGTASEIRSAAINVVSMVPGIFDRKTVSKKPAGANTLVKVTNEISISLDLVSKAEFYGYVDSAGLYLEPREKYDLNLPMKNITWKQAKDFCIWSSEYSRLPYRHEWVEAVDDSLITPPTDWHEWLSAGHLENRQTSVDVNHPVAGEKVVWSAGGKDQKLGFRCVVVNK